MAKWKMLLGSLMFILSICLCLEAHEGHSHSLADSDFLTHFFAVIGRFHLLFLHFPIALIVMTVVAEWLWIWFGNPMFSQAARFMISAAAIFAPITALLGLAFGYGQNYEGLSLELYVWHRYFGLLTAGLAILTAILRERYTLERSSSPKSYYISLFLLFLSVSLTGAFGGSLTFGLDVW
jgi:uncharacterized membrane protein